MSLRILVVDDHAVVRRGSDRCSKATRAGRCAAKRRPDATQSHRACAFGPTSL
jgi:hypothetical protein